MRTAFLRIGLAVAAAASVTAVSAGSASATTVRPNFTYWTYITTFMNPGAWDRCNSAGQADVANPSSPAIAYRCFAIQTEWSPGVYRTGQELDEEYGGGV
ncbi:hypothetical protein ABIA32_002339 [Streptacidiphilus sp. MAP12-20]|uniref:hypothetical protein n=1 Tax=Streptacidiphilus sp. MAP12-20 TaxID=3156299 RepID=UPI003514F77C